MKLIDFGLSSFFHTPTEPGGTPEFLAPELLLKPKLIQKMGIGPEVDMWAIGVLAYYLLSGATPFDASDVELILKKVKHGDWEFRGPAWRHVSEEARGLITALIKVGGSTAHAV